MKLAITFFTISLTIIFSFSNAQVVDWIAPEFGMGDKVTVDPFNNSYTCGQLYGTQQVGPYTFSSAGAQDVLIEKHSSRGALLWATKFGGAGAEFSSEIVYDGLGNIWVSGSFSGTMTVGSFSLNSLGTGSDVFLVKIDALTGVILFAERAGGSSSDDSGDLSVDNLGNIYLSGRFHGTLTYGALNVTGGSWDVFMLKIDNNGTGISGFAISGSGLITNWSSTVDASGNMYLGGHADAGAVDFNGTIVNYSQATKYIAKFDVNGNLIWSNEAVFTGDYKGLSIDAAGNIYFTGNISGGGSFGSINVSSGGSTDILIGKVDGSTGNFNWVKYYGGQASSEGYDLKCKQNGDLFMVGVCQDTFNFGPIPLVLGTSSLRTYVAKLDSSGLEKWIQVMDGGGTSKGIAINKSDGVFITGAGLGLITIANDTATALGSFLVRLSDDANEISGYVFNDGNNNGVFDSGENGMPNVIVQLNGGPYVRNSSATGRYEIFTSSGNHSVSIPTLPLYHTLSTPMSQSASFVGLGNTFSTSHFGLFPTPNMNDLTIDITPITNVNAGFGLAYMITYKNVGTTTLFGVVNLQSDASLVFLNASPVEDSQSGQTATWNIGSLLPGEVGTIQVNFNIPSSMNIGEELLSTAEITPISGDVTPLDNVNSNRSVVTGPYDPNYKIVDIDTLYGVTSSGWLEYIIHFQNVGNDTAYNVVIVDTMSSYLDLATFEMISYSHSSMVYTIRNGNIIDFVFDNIFLPDSTTDQVGSQGFIKYRVKHVASIPLNETIANFVDIYFDFNAAVRTNTATTVHLNAILGSEEVQQEKQIKLFPNPTENNIRIQFEKESLNSSISIIDLTGKTLRVINLGSGNHVDKTISFSEFDSGIYFLRIMDGSRVFTKKIIKR